MLTDWPTLIAELTKAIHNAGCLMAMAIIVAGVFIGISMPSSKR